MLLLLMLFYTTLTFEEIKNLSSCVCRVSQILFYFYEDWSSVLQCVLAVNKNYYFKYSSGSWCTGFVSSLVESFDLILLIFTSEGDHDKIEDIEIKIV